MGKVSETSDEVIFFEYEINNDTGTGVEVVASGFGVGDSATEDQVVFPRQ